LVITNRKAQTTRHRILGILNADDHQLILSDTPGILEPQYKLHKSMMRAVDEALRDADVLVILVELGMTPEKSELVLKRAARFEGPKLLLVNKVDKGEQVELIATLQQWQDAVPEAKVAAISALHGFNIDDLRNWLIGMLPEHPPYFPKDELSDRNTRFFVSEMIREHVLAQFKQEIPYSTEVVVNSFLDEPAIFKIQADIIVMREGQKGIIIGDGGTALRRLGTAARKDLERFLDRHVFLDLKVKVDENWRENDAKLKNYGY